MSSLAATEAASAKVNLALHVTGRRADGYHELESLVVFADIADEVSIVPAKADSFRLTGPFAPALSSSTPAGGAPNLVLRAIAAFRAAWPGRAPDGLSVLLQKNLPIAAGIGGGSADAAATLRLLAGNYAPNLAAADLAAVAQKLGADVPVCLFSQAALMTGIGEVLQPLDDFPPAHLVLVNPLIPVATSDVFRRLQSRDNPGLPPLPQPLTRPAQLGIWLTETRNDLQPAAIELVPVIGELIGALAAVEGCMLARMSGSGSTVFGLFGSGAQAHQAAHDLRERWPSYWVAAAPLV